jgi:Flp pilus assembly protein TadG
VLVELALVSPVLLALLFAAMQFGYSFYTYNNLQKAVRDGARYGASREYPSATFATAVTNVVVCGNPTSCSGLNPLVHSLTSSNVIVTVTPATGVPSVVTVKINGYTLPGPLGAVTLTNKPSCSFRFIGHYAPG